MSTQETHTATDVTRHPIIALLTRFRVYLTSLIMLAVFAMMAYAVYKLTNEVSYDDVFWHWRIPAGPQSSGPLPSPFSALLR